jgi:hypothetical protein
MAITITTTEKPGENKMKLLCCAAAVAFAWAPASEALESPGRYRYR